MKSFGYRAIPPRSVLVRNDYELPDLGSNQMYIDVLFCGLCHSDLHVIDGHFSKDPHRVAGHEVVGIVKEKGKDVTLFDVGQRVGVGWQSGSCGTCTHCLSGNENECAQEEATCLHSYGGLSKSIISNEKFTYDIPHALKSEHAAPLLCAGLSVYAPLKRFSLTKNSARVGILGIGGLGHLGVQFAAKMGYEVVAISTSPSKKQEAKSFGAHDFLTFDQFGSQKDSLDFILSTVPTNIDWKICHDALRADGELCQVGIILNSSTYAPIFSGSQKTFSQSRTGSPTMMREMLDFAAKNAIVPAVQQYSFGRINRVIEDLRNNNIRYRAVLYQDMV